MAAIAVSVVSTLGYKEASAQKGAVALETEDIEFTDTSLEAQAAEISVFVDNADGTLHTFTIDELDVNLNIPSFEIGTHHVPGRAGELRVLLRPP